MKTKFAASDIIQETLCHAVIARILSAKNNWQLELKIS